MQAKPDASKWKSKEIFNYNDLHELFAKDRASDSADETAKEKNKRRSSTSIGGWGSIEEINDLLSGNTVNLDNINNDNDVQFFAVTPSPQENFNFSEFVFCKHIVEIQRVNSSYCIVSKIKQSTPNKCKHECISNF